MSLKYTSVVIQDIWNSEVVQFLDCLLTDYWSTVGITSEIEARLGKITEGGFVSGVSQKFFYAMRDYLKSRNYWTDDNGAPVKPEVDDEYAVVFDQSVRVVAVSESGTYTIKEVVRKTTTEKRTFLFDENMYSLRISLAEEAPLTEQDKAAYSQAALSYLMRSPSAYRVNLVRHRERITFNFRNDYRLDMTATQSAESMADVHNAPTVYEVECELCLPKHGHCETLFLYLNAILHRMFTQPEAVCMPPVASRFHPGYVAKLEAASHGQVVLKGDVELLNSEGYDDSLIAWCKKRNPEGKAILPFQEAKQLKWSLAHPCSLPTLQGLSFPTDASPSDCARVINDGGMIRTEAGEVFHCCIWQYEGVALLANPNQSSSVKRSANPSFCVCSKMAPISATRRTPFFSQFPGCQFVIAACFELLVGDIQRGAMGAVFLTCL